METKKKSDFVISDPKNIKKMSPYAKFHFKYLGYNFKNKLTGKIYTKGVFWDQFRQTAIANSFSEIKNLPTPPIGFELIEYVSHDFDEWQELIESKRKVK